MDRFLVIVALGGLSLAQISSASAQLEPSSETQPALKPESQSDAKPALPAAPQGKSTVIGGEIQKIDSVLDQFALKVFGQRPIKVLFDERTQVYRDGKRIPLREMRQNEHASVQTVLDGTSVFALSIHALSQASEGEYQGQVLDYDSGTGELNVSAALSRAPIKIFVNADTPFIRKGQEESSSKQAGPSALVKGSLISVKFESDKKGRGVATQISILATPGSAFVFSGSLSSFDLHSGLMVLVDPRDERSFEIFFDSARLPASQTLHPGELLTVTAEFDGARYVARAITVN